MEEILSHEQALSRYLSRAWAHHDEIGDLRQEIYLKVYEAARRARPDVSAKSFLFTTARNLMADRVRRAKVVSIQAMDEIVISELLIDELTPERKTAAHQEFGHLIAAFQAMPPRCQEVFWLRRVEHLSQRETSLKLGITEKAVESLMAKGVRLIAEGWDRRLGPPGRVRAEDLA